MWKSYPVRAFVTAVSADTLSRLKSRLDKWRLTNDNVWPNNVIFNFRAEIQGTGSGSEVTVNIDTVCLLRNPAVATRPRDAPCWKSCCHSKSLKITRTNTCCKENSCWIKKHIIWMFLDFVQFSSVQFSSLHS